MKVLVVVPMSHTWFWPDTCLTCLQRYDPGTPCEFVFVDNAWEWSPAAEGIADRVRVLRSEKPLRTHSTALDHVVETGDFDFLFTLETDVLILRDGWLKWYTDQWRPGIFAIGAWHHEDFVNPSATLYHGDALRAMREWSHRDLRREMHWGPGFQEAAPMPLLEWTSRGAFQERRGWPPGTVIDPPPRHQHLDPGHYEPGEQFYHWARDRRLAAVTVPTYTQRDAARGIPLATHYYYEGHEPYLVHLWAGTRALDCLKHPVLDPMIRENQRFWLEREARTWRECVPPTRQAETIARLRAHGWHYPEAEALRQEQFSWFWAAHPELCEGDWPAREAARVKQAAAEVTALYQAAGLPL